MRAPICRRWYEFKDLRLEEISEPELRPGGVRPVLPYTSLGFAISLDMAGKDQRKPPGYAGRFRGR